MQAVSNKHIRFVVFDPLFIVESYEPVITDEVLTKLGAESLSSLVFYVIAVVPKDIRDMTVRSEKPDCHQPADQKSLSGYP